MLLLNIYFHYLTLKLDLINLNLILPLKHRQKFDLIFHNQNIYFRSLELVILFELLAHIQFEKILLLYLIHLHKVLENNFELGCLYNRMFLLLLYQQQKLKYLVNSSLFEIESFRQILKTYRLLKNEKRFVVLVVCLGAYQG